MEGIKLVTLYFENFANLPVAIQLVTRVTLNMDVI